MDRKKILVVDNNKFFRKLLTTFLDREGHEVIEAESGFRALRIVNDFIPDIIFIDLVMPRINGVNLCRIFRNIPELEDTYLVIVSAVAVEEQPNLHEIGANACIAKGPFKQMTYHVNETIKESAGTAVSLQDQSIRGGESLFPRQITQELLDQSYHLEDILSSVSQGVVELEAGHVVYVNPAAVELLGVSEKKLYSSRLKSLVEPQVWEEVEWLIENSKGGEEKYTEQTLLTLGDYMVILQVMTASRYSNNPILLLTDITKRWQAEETARDAASRISTFFSAINDAIFVHPLLEEGFAPFIEVNDIACRKYGYSREEFLGLTAMDITLKSDAKTHADAEYRNELMKRGNWVFEATHIKKSGKTFPVEINSNIVEQRGRKVILAVVRDISKRKEAQREKEILEAKLQQTQKMEAVGRLAGGVAHDFNNMLSVILGFAEITLDELQESDPLHQNIVKIQKAAEHSADLTRQLLAFARKQNVVPKVLELNQTLSHMLTMLRRLIGEYILLEHLPEEELWPVLMDPTQVNQIIVNLILNARDALLEGGRITITTRNIELDNEYCQEHPGFIPGEYVAVGVSDNGFGIQPEILPMIFEPFFTTKPVGEGTGLGLSTVYGILKQNNGFINVESDPGTKTTFTIYFPKYSGEDQIRLAKSPDLLESENETILVVEDEPTILDMLKVMFTRLGYQVLLASSPGQALELAAEKSGEIDLVMTDVVMPEMNGLELVNELKSRYSGLRFLFSSGYTTNIIANHGIIDKEHHFIQKPFSEKELAIKLREVLSEVPQKS